MKSVFASDLAIAVLAALEHHPEGLPLASIARLAGAPLSAAQTAVRLLIDAGLVAADAETRPRYAIPPAAEAPARHLVTAALGLGQRGVLDAAIRGQPAVEFASRDADGVMVVLRIDAGERDRAIMADLADRAGTRVECHGHDELRAANSFTAGLRERALGGRLVTGTVDRSLPDRSALPAAPGRPLGRLHPGLGQVSAAAVARVAREFGLEEVRVVGAAVRDDFGPGSDVDVAVRRRRRGPRLEGDLRLRRALEDLFDHDVRVIDESSRRPGRDDDTAEGITLYGASRRGLDMVEQDLNRRLVEIADAVPVASLEAAWAGIAPADRVPPDMRTDEPDRGFSHLWSPSHLRAGLRHLYAVRLAGGDIERYRRITQVGLRFLLDRLDAKRFEAYVEWLDDLERRYPGKLDVIFAAYRAAGPPQPSWFPSFDEVVAAYEERAAELDR